MRRLILAAQFLSWGFLVLPPTPTDNTLQLFRRIRSNVVTNVGISESELFLKEVEKVKAEWAEQSSRGRQLTRLHTPEQVAALRIRGLDFGYTVQRAMAWKLYDLLRSHQQNKTSIVTIGGFDEVSTDAMARAGTEALYRGGWDASMRWGAPDLARYPYDFVRQSVGRFSRFLIQHERIQSVQRAQMTPEQQRASPKTDFLMPMIVDMDEAHGKPLEMAELMLTPSDDSNGDPPLIGAVHLEDQAVYCKKCGHMAGKVLVSIREMIERLNQVRLQFDIMGIPTLIIARTDSEAAEFITSTQDERDHPFILGATAGIKSYAEVIQEAWNSGKSAKEVEAISENWKKEANIMSLGEAIGRVIELAEKEGKNPGISAEDWRTLTKTTSHKDLLSRAEKLKIVIDEGLKKEAEKLGIIIKGNNGEQVGVYIHDLVSWGNFQKPGARFPKGINMLWDMNMASLAGDGYTYWMINSGLEMAIARSKAFLPYSDMGWMEQHHPDAAEIETWAAALKSEAQRLGMPNAPLLGVNVSPSFYFPSHFTNEQELRDYYDRQARAGVQFQFNTYGAGQVIHESMRSFLEDFKKNGALAWSNFQKRAKEAGNPFVGSSQTFAGVTWAATRDAAGRGHQLIVSPLGAKDTMAQFKQDVPVIQATQPAMFPDAGLERAIREALNKPTGEITIADLQTITELDISGRVLVSLQGLQYATNLTKLIADHNNLTELESIRGLVNIATLDVSYNQLTSIAAASGMRRLRYFDGASNRLADIEPARNWTELEEFNISYNRKLGEEPLDITPVENLVRLKALGISGLQLKHIKPLYKLVNLEILFADHNQLTDIEPSRGLINLIGFDVSDNLLTGIPWVSRMNKLKYFDVSSNRLTDLESVRNLTDLEALNISSNRRPGEDPLDITPLENLVRLKALAANGLQLKDIKPVRNLTELEDAYLYDNQISDISPLAGLINLQWAGLGGNQINDIAAFLPLVMQGLGLSAEGVLDLTQNPLSSKAKADVEELLKLGVDVWK